MSSKMQGLEREVIQLPFFLIVITALLIMLSCLELFNQAAVYPREIAKAALELNAAAFIVAHNHPSGEAHQQ